MAEKTIAMNQEQQLPQAGEKTRSNARYAAPPVDIFEQDEKLVLVADLPGIDKDHLTVDVKEGILTLQATTDAKSSGNGAYREFELVNYFRQFELSEKVDVEKISADLKNGVLTLQLPKAEKAKPRRISVDVH